MNDNDRLRPDADETLERALAKVPWYVPLLPLGLALVAVLMVIVIGLTVK